MSRNVKQGGGGDGKVKKSVPGLCAPGSMLIRDLAVAILMRAWLDTGRCYTEKEKCPRWCREQAEHCDLRRFWASEYAAALCDLAGIDIELARKRVAERLKSAVQDGTKLDDDFVLK